MASPSELIWIDIDDELAVVIRSYSRASNEATCAGQAALSIYLTGGTGYWMDVRAGRKPKSSGKINASVKGVACRNKRKPVDTYYLTIPTLMVKPDVAYVLAVDVPAGTQMSRRVCLVGWSFGSGLRTSRRKGEGDSLRGSDLRPMYKLKEIRSG